MVDENTPVTALWVTSGEGSVLLTEDGLDIGPVPEWVDQIHWVVYGTRQDEEA